MRQRDIIYLKENEFCITGAAIWMSEWELAELFYATQGEIRAAINRVLKDGAIPSCHNTRYMPLENGNAAEVYSLEAIIAISFYLHTGFAAKFRRWITERITRDNKQVASLLLYVGSGLEC
ncbi:hypothetical protein [Prevotella nigrescens]|uniref:hypothetical protein n=1 Tax=Prevotella nigrescens TaxID=28133 RepID=UPI0028DBC593|nr:hypothetical protein [Prevotella nigrescens]